VHFVSPAKSAIVVYAVSGLLVASCRIEGFVPRPNIQFSGVGISASDMAVKPHADGRHFNRRVIVSAFPTHGVGAVWSSLFSMVETLPEDSATEPHYFQKAFGSRRRSSTARARAAGGYSQSTHEQRTTSAQGLHVDLFVIEFALVPAPEDVANPFERQASNCEPLIRFTILPRDTSAFPSRSFDLPALDGSYKRVVINFGLVGVLGGELPQCGGHLYA